MRDDDLRKLWQQQPTPRLALSTEALRKKATSFRLHRSLGDLSRVLAFGFMAVFFAYVAFRRYGWELPGVLAKIGAMGMAAGAVVSIYQVRKFWTRAVPAESASTPLLAFHVEELGRRRDLLMNFWKLVILPPIPGLLLIMTEVALRPGNPVPMLLPAVAMLALAVMSSLMNRRRARRLQRDIDALAALQ